MNLEWYYRVSHPLIIPYSSVYHSNIVGLSVVVGLLDDISPTPRPSGMTEWHRLQTKMLLYDNLMGLINIYDEVYALAAHNTHITRGGQL